MDGRSMSCLNVFTVILWCLLITSCGETNELEIHYIVPNELEGFHLLKFDKAKPDLKETFLKVILDSGDQTLIANSQIFGIYHRTSASRVNGQQIPCNMETAAEPSLWEVSASQDGIIIFVGEQKYIKIFTDKTRVMTIQELNQKYMGNKSGPQAGPQTSK
jgi:hypothetical protein